MKTQSPGLVIILFVLLCSLKSFSNESIQNHYNLDIFVKKSTFAITGPSNEQMELMGVNQLSQTDFDNFLKTRYDFLNHAARLLQNLKYGFGVGYIIKDKYQFYKEKKQIQELIELANTIDSSARYDMLNSAQQGKEELQYRISESKDKTFSTKANQVILSILGSIDSQLWHQASIVSHANEFGIMLAAGAEAEGGGRNTKGWGGLTDIGISLGYNRDEKAVAIQIFHDLEPFQSTQMPMVFIAGLVAKAGIYVANQGEDLTARGSSFYPPMAPGFSSQTNRSFMAGFSSGMTWPPSPIGDMLTYSNKLKQTTLFRLTLSPLTKGFIRIRSGALKEIINAAYIPIKNLILKPSAYKCSSLF